MLARLKENIAFAWDGLFGDRYGFFDLMVDAGKFPAARADIVRLFPRAERPEPAPAAPAAPAGGLRKAA